MTEQTPPRGEHQGLVLKGLVLRRGEKLILRGVELTLAPSQALVLLGPNGAGKTSLLRLLAGLLPRAAGSLSFAGLDPRTELEAYAAKLHYLGHRDGVKPALTVAENLHFWTALLGAPLDRGKQEAALGGFGLSRAGDLPASYLSAGQKRRLALTRLLAVPRPLWLLDEPAAGLDADGRGRLGEAIAAHRQAGGLLVMASHGELSVPEARIFRVGEAA